jgi:ABC-type multidrug transport system fused ATPase/permease subunit
MEIASPAAAHASKSAAETVRRRRRGFTRTFYENNHTAFIAAAIFLLINSALDIFVAYLLQEILDEATGGTVGRLMELLIYAGAFFAASWVTWLAVRGMKNRFVKRAMQHYKEAAFEKITKKSISSFAEETTSRYISALTNDAASVEQNYLLSSFKLLTNVVWFFGALAMMLWYDWSMTLIVIGLSILPMAVSFAFGGKLVKAEKTVSEKNESFVGMIKDLLTGFTVIKSFKAEKEIAELFRKHNSSLEENKTKRRLTEELIQIISAAAGFIVQFGIFFYGAYLALTGKGVTVGVVIAFVQLVNFVLMPVRDLPALFANRKAAVALIDKLAEAVEVNAGRPGKPIDNILNDCIAVEHVDFGYEPGELVLKNISARFEAGKSYAIVGGSGSGKTTFLNLLMGSYDTYAGRITFDGNELRDISSDSLYDMLSIVQQNVFVFDSSIIDNITLFKEFDGQSVQNAVERAGLTELLSERGRDYRCGENGSGLSGGERQRISIARCLLRNTPVLLMDEATAALDTSTAHAITYSVLDIKGLTRIIVTHKLEESILRKYDEIIVIRNGTIFERGTFAELIEKKEYFYSLYMVSRAE